jgi:hypothetical protein
MESRLWTPIIRRRHSRRCDSMCRTSLGPFWGLIYRWWRVGHLGLVAWPIELPMPTRSTTPAASACIGNSGYKTRPWHAWWTD